MDLKTASKPKAVAVALAYPLVFVVYNVKSLFKAVTAALLSA